MRPSAETPGESMPMPCAALWREFVVVSGTGSGRVRTPA
jgi:hypothetical protein